MSSATATLSKEEKNRIVLEAAAKDGGVTVSEIKGDLDGHAGRTALLFTSLCRSGKLKKTGDKRNGKVIYVTGDGTPAPVKRKKKAEAKTEKKTEAKPVKKASKATTKVLPKGGPKKSRKTDAVERRDAGVFPRPNITTGGQEPELTITEGGGKTLETPIMNNAARKAKAQENLDKAIQDAEEAGIATGRSLMDARNQIDAFIRGLRKSLEF